MSPQQGIWFVHTKPRVEVSPAFAKAMTAFRGAQDRGRDGSRLERRAARPRCVRRGNRVRGEEGEEVTFRILIDDIKAVVAAEHGLTVRELVGPRRARRISRPRQIAITLAVNLTNNTRPKIGDLFGGRDHSTVHHAVQAVRERGTDLAPLVEKIRAHAEERRLRIDAEAELAAFDAGTVVAEVQGPPPSPGPLPRRAAIVHVEWVKPEEPWRGMETAPMDGTPIRVQIKGKQPERPHELDIPVCYADGKWRFATTMAPLFPWHRPVRWKPLPVEQKAVAA